MGIDSELNQALTPDMTPEQRKEAQLRILVVNARMSVAQLAELAVAQHNTDKRLDGIETSLGQNTEITTEVRELLNTFRGGMKVLSWLGTAAKWIGALASAGAAIYTAVYMATHGGQLPGGK